MRVKVLWCDLKYGTKITFIFIRLTVGSRDNLQINFYYLVNSFVDALRVSKKRHKFLIKNSFFLTFCVSTLYTVDKQRRNINKNIVHFGGERFASFCRTIIKKKKKENKRIVLRKCVLLIYSVLWYELARVTHRFTVLLSLEQCTCKVST